MKQAAVACEVFDVKKVSMITINDVNQTIEIQWIPLCGAMG